MSGEQDRRGDFDAFVRKQQPAPPEDRPIDWAHERDDWLRRLNELYEKIESFLAKYIESDQIKRDYRDITLNEENIGSYTARQLILQIGRQTIALTPAGTMLIGAKGRVDVAGPAGRTRLLLVDSRASRPQIKVTVVSPSGRQRSDMPPKEEPPKEIKWAWKIATNVPTVQYIELTQESLFQALMEVANG